MSDFPWYKLFYWRYIYRRHMRLIHSFGLHWHTYIYPIDGPEQQWCQWCGDRIIHLPPVAAQPTQKDRDN